MSYCIVLNLIVLYCFVLNRIVLYRIVSYCIILNRIVLYCDWVCTAVMSNDVMKDLRG